MHLMGGAVPTVEAFASFQLALLLSYHRVDHLFGESEHSHDVVIEHTHSARGDGPIASSSRPRTPSLRTTMTSSGAWSALETSYATDTPPRGKASTRISGRFAYVASLVANSCPAAVAKSLLFHRCSPLVTGSISILLIDHLMLLPFQIEYRVATSEQDHSATTFSHEELTIYARVLHIRKDDDRLCNQIARNMLTFRDLLSAKDAHLMLYLERYRPKWSDELVAMPGNEHPPSRSALSTMARGYMGIQAQDCDKRVRRKASSVMLL